MSGRTYELMIKEVYRAMLENQNAQTELLDAIWKDAQPVRVQEALDLFRHIYDENVKLKAELQAIKERPTGMPTLISNVNMMATVVGTEPSRRVLLRDGHCVMHPQLLAEMQTSFGHDSVGITVVANG